MTTSKAKRRQRQCGQKVRYKTLEAANVIATRKLQDRIYDRMEPRAYQCDYGNHYHVGHSLKAHNKCVQQSPVMDVTNSEAVSRPTDPAKRGRPALEPTETITVRLPVSTLDIIKRRAEKAHMAPSVYLAERVIFHEVVRSHHPKTKRK